MIVFIIASSIITLNSLHVITAWFRQPADTVFTGIAHYFADYFLYISLMGQGRFIFTDHLYTNEPIEQTWIYWLYTLLGKLGFPFLIYNLSIVVFSAVLLWLWWNIIKKITHDTPTRIIAFFLLTTASGVAGFDFWFSPFPALNRLGGVPHQIFQTLLILLVFYLYHLKKYIPLIAVSFLSATANPIQMLVVTLSLGAVSIMKHQYGRLLAVAFPALVGAYLVNTEFSGNHILLAAKAWENSQSVSVPFWNFILAIGPMALFFILGIKRFSQTVTPIKLSLLWYCGLSFILFFSPIPAILSTSPVRWLSPAAYGIFPIIAAFGLYKFRYPLLFAYLLLTIPSIVSQVQARQHNPAHLNYIPRPVITNLQSLSGTGVILTDPKTPYDVIVPVFTGRKSFTGHPIHTLFPGTKEALRQHYFSGRMSDTNKKLFLEDHNITTTFP